jgi:hypothetical protein
MDGVVVGRERIGGRVEESQQMPGATRVIDTRGRKRNERWRESSSLSSSEAAE